MWKKLGKTLLFLALACVAVAVVGIGYLTLTEYRPPAEEELELSQPSETAFSAEQIRVLTFNTGYAGLGEESDFFMDGGKQVAPGSEGLEEKNEAGILQQILAADPDVALLQEVDRDSSRSFRKDQAARYADGLSRPFVFALNYKCAFVPYPLPPIGKVESGLQTLTGYQIADAERVSLTCPFSWPVSAANLKRCLLVSSLPLSGTDKRLVIINLHLEAYDDGAGRAQQLRELLGRMQAEYAAGNYVIAGGDFNCSFPGAEEAYPLLNGALWSPGTLDAGQLPQGYSFAYDLSVPSCRLLDAPYEAGVNQTYVIDGFLLSPNVQAVSVETLDQGFRYSDHNPVLLTARLAEP